MKRIFIFIISLYSLCLWSQTDSLQENKTKKSNKQFSASVGVDLFQPTVGLFTDKKGYSALVSLQFYKNWFMHFQLGTEKNYYNDLGWKINVSGTYFKLGGNYIITRDRTLLNNKFYIGGRIAYSSFNQEMKQAPIRSDNVTIVYTSLPKDKANALWFELPIGATINIIKNKLFIETIVQPKILLHTKSNNGAGPIVIPEFGVNQNNLNINLFWGISYLIK